MEETGEERDVVRPMLTPSRCRPQRIVTISEDGEPPLVSPCMSTPGSTTNGFGRPRLMSTQSNMSVKSTISDYLQTSGYYTCISANPLPLLWEMPEDFAFEGSPAGITFEAGNVVRMRSFLYKEPWLWAEVLSGGFVCAGRGDSRREAAGELLEEYFEPFHLPSGDGDEELVARQKLERQATNAFKALTTKRASVTLAVSMEAPPAASESSSESDDENDGNSENQILDLFRRFDINGDGAITLEELSEVLMSLDAEKWTDTKVRNLMSIMDTKKDRSISYEQFVDWVSCTNRWVKERRTFFKQLGVRTPKLREMAHVVQHRGSLIRKSIAPGFMT